MLSERHPDGTFVILPVEHASQPASDCVCAERTARRAVRATSRGATAASAPRAKRRSPLGLSLHCMTTLGRYVAALHNCGLRSSDRVAVALSGGPDSLALASMTVRWQGFVKRQQAPLALIVDHKLRPESTEEVHAVATQAAELGMQTRVLTIDWPLEPVAAGNKMVAAREARYAALLRACGELGRSHLLLGHHAGDQAETFLLRLLHASGVVGLACMPRVVEKCTEFGRVKIVRPLLAFHKHELEEYCRRSGLQYVIDRTNSDLLYHRNRIRHVLQQFPAASPLLQVAEGVAGFSGDGSGGAAAGSMSGGGAQGLAPHSSSSTTWQEVEGLEDDAGSSSSSSYSRGSKCESIASDLLLLQRRCEAAMLQQQALGDCLLLWAVLHTSCPNLPRRPSSGEKHAAWQQAEQALQQALQDGPGWEPSEEMQVAWKKRERRRAYPGMQQAGAAKQPWYIDWDMRLAQVAHVLRPLPYAVLSASHFSEEHALEQMSLGALSRVLQAVSGCKYPPPLAHTIKLREMLLPGRMYATFTGGGCLVKRLSRCKGRFVLCIPQEHHAWAQQLLAKLPPINVYEEARQREEAAAAQAAEAGEGEPLALENVS